MLRLYRIQNDYSPIMIRKSVQNQYKKRWSINMHDKLLAIVIINA